MRERDHRVASSGCGVASPMVTLLGASRRGGRRAGAAGRTASGTLAYGGGALAIRVPNGYVDGSHAGDRRTRRVRRWCERRNRCTRRVRRSVPEGDCRTRQVHQRVHASRSMYPAGTLMNRRAATDVPRGTSTDSTGRCDVPGRHSGRGRGGDRCTRSVRRRIPVWRLVYPAGDRRIPAPIGVPRRFLRCKCAEARAPGRFLDFFSPWRPSAQPFPVRATSAAIHAARAWLVPPA
jgi:hypothetical protein